MNNKKRSGTRNRCAVLLQCDRKSFPVIKGKKLQKSERLSESADSFLRLSFMHLEQKNAMLALVVQAHILYQPSAFFDQEPCVQNCTSGTTISQMYGFIFGTFLSF